MPMRVNGQVHTLSGFGHFRAMSISSCCRAASVCESMGENMPALDAFDDWFIKMRVSVHLLQRQQDDMVPISTSPLTNRLRSFMSPKRNTPVSRQIGSSRSFKNKFLTSLSRVSCGYPPLRCQNSANPSGAVSKV